MRIEIFASGQVSVSMLNGTLTNLNKSISETIKSLSSVNKKLSSLPGGVQGHISNAISSIDERIKKEESKKASLQQSIKHIDDFEETTVLTDLSVARNVSQNQEKFFSINPWARPTAVGQKNWWEEIISSWSWSSIKEKFVNAWQGIVDFYNNHPIISRIIIGVAFAAIGYALISISAVHAATLVTSATAHSIATVLSATRAGYLIGTATSFAVSSVIGAAIGAIRGGLQGVFQGAADGFMNGGILALSGALLSGFTSLANVPLFIATRGLSGGISDAIDDGLSSGTFSDAINGFLIGSATGALTAAITAGLGKWYMKIKADKVKGKILKYAPSNKRPPYAKGQRDTVWNKYYNPDLDVQLDMAGREITKNNFQMGHRTGYEIRYDRQLYEKGLLSEPNFIRHFQNANNYRPEHKITNSSHAYESRPIIELMFPFLKGFIYNLPKSKK
ncbi:MAG: hypothetical protein LBT59_14835 [Clostridiales bacterium]|nr:hypothetical protein [Clostridiales bacterium]